MLNSGQKVVSLRESNYLISNDKFTTPVILDLSSASTRLKLNYSNLLYKHLRND